jgi:hypothetical protein
MPNALMISRRRWLAACTGLVLVPVQAAEPVPAATPLPALPEAAARYRVSFSAAGQPTRVQHWTLTRSPSLVALHKGDTEELWRRDASGVRLERIYRTERHVVEYAAGELRALGIEPDWQALGSLFDERRLQHLSLQRRATPRAHYRGELNGERVDLEWDPMLHLPLRLTRRAKSAQVHFERLEAHAGVPAGWPEAGAGTTDFQRIDAADFGDMESNPFVRKVLAQDARAGWRKE